MGSTDDATTYSVQTFAGRQVMITGAGPPVVILHELFGVTPALRRFAGGLAAAGFTAHVVVLEGGPASDGPVSRLSVAARLCISREYRRLAEGRPSRFGQWLSAYISSIAGATGSRVGVIGMCFSGGFALAAAAAQVRVGAAIAAEPSWPRGGGASPSAIGLDTADAGVLGRRIAMGEVRVFGVRFSDDRICPALRLEAMAAIGVPKADLLTVDSSEGNPGGFDRRSHSVLTNSRPAGLVGEEQLARIRADIFAMLRAEL